MKRLTVDFAEVEQRLSYNISSIMQGVLMERTSPDYGEVLHQSKLKPYSQFAFNTDGVLQWTVNTLDDVAFEQLIQPILQDDYQSVFLRQKQLELKITKKELKELTFESLLADTFFGDCSRYITIRFKTPTAFKNDGRYQFYPTVWHVFKSLANKFDASAIGTEIAYQQTLEDIEEHVQIIRYNLRSTVFYLESVKIPSFVGTVTFKVNGPQQLVNLINLLARFGEYSGVGIKAAMGMGAIEIIERKENGLYGKNKD